MFVGHALLAFALAVLFAEWRGWSTQRALTLGVATGAFAALPDVDVVYALFALDGGQFLNGGSVDPTAFWAAANSVHRSMTHSVIVALAAGPAFGLLAVRGTRGRVNRALAGMLLAGLVAVAVAVSGPLGGVVMGAFVLAGAAIATLSRRWTDLSPRLVGIAAAAGLLTHPWGDLVTGQPPQLLYPFAAGVFDGRVVLHPDPTIHLLGAFALELATVWLAALAVVRVTDRSPGPLFDRTATLGAAYSVVPLVLVPPTLDVSYHFVFSILAVGAVCGAASWYRSASPLAAFRTRPAWGALSTERLRPAVGSGFPYVATGLEGITVALIGYALVYVAL
ncbi:metal-dependent hydrolase [Halobellus sp. GM3]|uniref:metal-dependent hydrolase n=1 Tax=Halobellus sp. GM3 TaxID=3458410 RepID=UPI00403DDF52